MARAGKGLIWNLAFLSHNKIFFSVKKVVFRNKRHQSPSLPELASLLTPFFHCTFVCEHHLYVGSARCTGDTEINEI